ARGPADNKNPPCGGSRTDSHPIYQREEALAIAGGFGGLPSPPPRKPNGGHSSPQAPPPPPPGPPPPGGGGTPPPPPAPPPAPARGGAAAAAAAAPSPARRAEIWAAWRRPPAGVVPPAPPPPGPGPTPPPPPLATSALLGPFFTTISAMPKACSRSTVDSGLGSPHRIASSSNAGSATSTRLSVSMNTVRARPTSPFQPRGRKLPSNATSTPALRAISSTARKRPRPMLE